MLRILSFLFVLFIMFTSCQKELSSENPLPQGPTNTTADSIYLSKITQVTKDNSNALVDSLVFEFSYDNLKRVSQYKIKNLIVNDSDRIQYYYNGTSPYPYRDSSLDGHSDSHFYTYNPSNQIIKDSFVQSMLFYNIYTVKKYAYSNGKIFVTTTDSAPPPINIIKLTMDTSILDVNNNIVSQKGWNYSAQPSFLNFLATYIYDSKNSPYKMVNIAQNIGFIHETEYGVAPQTNNILTLSQNDLSATMQFNFSRTYTYNSKDYPTKCLEVETTYPTKTAYNYYYTAL